MTRDADNPRAPSSAKARVYLLSFFKIFISFIGRNDSLSFIFKNVHYFENSWSILHKEPCLYFRFLGTSGRLGWTNGSIPRVGEMGQELCADVAAMALRPAQTSQLRGYSQGTMFQPWERVMRLPVPSLGFWARSGPSLTVGLVIASSGLAWCVLPRSIWGDCLPPHELSSWHLQRHQGAGIGGRKYFKV